MDANQAEMMAIEELQKPSQAMLNQWADKTKHVAIDPVRRDDPTLRGNGKKTLVVFRLRNHLSKRASFTQGATGKNQVTLSRVCQNQIARMLPSV